MSQPGLHRPDVDSGAQPTGRGGIAEAVQVPGGAIEFGARRYVLAEVMEKARACEMLRMLRRGKHERAISWFKIRNREYSQMEGT